MTDDQLFGKEWEAIDDMDCHPEAVPYIYKYSKRMFLAGIRIGREQEREECAMIAEKIETERWAKVGDPRINQLYCPIAEAIRQRI